MPRPSYTGPPRKMFAVYLHPRTKDQLQILATRRGFNGISPFVCDYLDQLVTRSKPKETESREHVRRRPQKLGKVRVLLNLRTDTKEALEAMAAQSGYEYGLDPYIETLLEDAVKSAVG